MSWLANPYGIKLLYSACSMAAIYLMGLLIVKVINRNVVDVRRRHFARKGVMQIGFALMAAIVGLIWIEQLKAIAVFLSIIGAGLVLALQEVILCVAGWLLIFTRRPFEAGDRVDLGGVKGDVIDIRLFQTSLLEIGNWVVDDQSTGRIANVSNSAVFKGPVFNYTRGFEFIWNEIKLVVTFESDWRKAKDIMLHLGEDESKELIKEAGPKIDEMAKRYMIYYEKFTPIVYTKIEENGIQLSLRYLIDAKQRRASTDRISNRLLEEFQKYKEINFAYPTYRITGVR